MIIIGLTGSIAMGKSTISKQAINLGIKVIDTDQLAKELLLKLDEIKIAFPETIIENQVDAALMAKIVFANTEKLTQLEEIIYPKLTDFILSKLKQYQRNNTKFIIIDAPKLFEAGLDFLCDYIITVHAPKFIQLQRVHKRKKYTEQQIKYIINHQIPNHRKVFLSDLKILTSLGRQHSMQLLKKFINTIRQET